jgi:DNA-binding MarR family transcriptional regulator
METRGFVRREPDPTDGRCKVTVGVKAYGGKQVQRLGSHWADPTRSNGLLEQ